MKTMLTFIATILLTQVMGQELTTASSNGAKLKITITDVQSQAGKLLIGIQNKEADFLKSDYKTLIKTPEKGIPMIVEFENLPAGTYTSVVVHDLNDNKELDTNFMGIPTEPYGISMQGKNKYGPPSYDKAVFEIKDTDHAITISLK